jgi:Protein of unknown function (DUF2726)
MQDREQLFQLLATKDWDRLSEVLYRQRAVLGSDPVIQHAVSLFEQEFLGHLASLTAEARVQKLRHISLIIEANRASFAPTFVDKAIDAKLTALYETKSEAFAGYASQYFDRPLAKELLKKTKIERPEHLADARRENASVKAVPQVRDRSSSTTSLFKSPQERYFYEAVRCAFPELLPYPNVPVSVTINFEAVKGKLSEEARSYYFKALFDCVVFDPGADHTPLHFFELDSSYHSSAPAQSNDRMKNAICVAANVKLLRIRAFNAREATVEAFAELLRELIQRAGTQDGAA